MKRADIIERRAPLFTDGPRLLPYVGIGIVLLISLTSRAQTQGNVPQITDVYSDAILGATVGAVTMGEPVVTGDKLIGAVRAVPGSTIAFSDTLANSWTCTTPVATPAPSAFQELYFCYADASSGGADTMTACAANQCELTVLRGVHLGAIDGTPVNTTNAVSGVSSFTSSVTTTTNASLIISGMVDGNNGAASFRGDYTSGAAGASSVKLGTIQTRTGALGTYVITADADNQVAFGAWSTQAMQSIAFKPAAIALTDTAYHQGAVGIAYSEQLHGVGGTAGLTYACTVLPSNGLSLNTATGKISGATPTLGTITPSCTVTDGSVTSSANALPIVIGATFDTPTIRSSGATTDTGSTTIPVQCGDVVVIVARGDDTHYTTGWLQKWNGTNNYVSDGWSSTVQRYIGPWGAMYPYPVVAYIIGPVAFTGAETITINNNQSASTNLGDSLYYVIRGVQGIVDSGAVTNIMTATNTSSVAASYTTLVPNTLLIGAIVGQGTTSISVVGTPSMSSPFNVLSSGTGGHGATIYGYYLSPTATSVTLTNSVTAQGTADNTWTTMLIPLRPAITPVSGCAAAVPQIEKQRRQVW